MLGYKFKCPNCGSKRYYFRSISLTAGSFYYFICALCGSQWVPSYMLWTPAMAKGTTFTGELGGMC